MVDGMTATDDAQRVYVDVGGFVYTSTRTSLCKSPVLKNILESCKNELEAPFVDRDGGLFHFILYFLRTGTIYSIDDRNVLQQLLGEAGFYGLRQMESQISKQLVDRRRTELLPDVVAELKQIKDIMQNVANVLIDRETRDAPSGRTTERTLE